MVARELLDPDTSLWHWIASDLHFYRTKHGMTLSQVGEHIGLKKAAVSNLEAARSGFRLQARQAETLDTLWNLNGHFSRLLRYALRVHNPEWFQNYTEQEQRASKIKVYDLALVPGLLQTEGYARALLSAGLVDNIDRALTQRMARQKIFRGPKVPELWVLLSQSVLDQPVGGREVMREQLTKILDTSRLPHVVLRVVPREVGAHMGLDGAFSIIYAGGSRSTYLEAVGGGRLSDDPSVVDRYEIRFDRIGADALSREASRHMITELIEGMS